MPAYVTAKQIADKLAEADLSSLPTTNPSGGLPWLSGGRVVVGDVSDSGYSSEEIDALIAGLVPYTGGDGDVDIGENYLISSGVKFYDYVNENYVGYQHQTGQRVRQA